MTRAWTPSSRVQARRLRIRLATYYRDEGQNDQVVIELPKGGYTPIFRKVETAVPKRPAGAVLVGRNTVMVLPFEDDSPQATRLTSAKASGTRSSTRCRGRIPILLVSRESDLESAHGACPAAA